MIKIKNLAEAEFKMVKAGSAAVANDIDGFVAPFGGFIKAIYAAFGVMGTDGTGSPTQDVIVDIKKNQTSIFSGATKINFTHALELGTANKSVAADNYGAFSANPTQIAKGDFLRLDITQILNGTSPTQPTDLTVIVVLGRNRNSQFATLTGQVDEND